MRSGRAEGKPEPVRDLRELRAARAHQLGGLGEGLAPAGSHLRFGRDQLADEVVVDGTPGSGRLHVLEAVDQRERLRIEERELLLDRDRQIGAALEGRPRLLEQLLVGNLLRFTH